jgi:hypothetical protein
MELDFSDKIPEKKTCGKCGCDEQECDNARPIIGEEIEIEFNKRVVDALRERVRAHNKKYQQKTSLLQLKLVYKRGAIAFSENHASGKTRGECAIARVNMFLKMLRGGKVRESYKEIDENIIISPETAPESVENFRFTIEELIEAKLYCQRFGVEYDESYSFLEDEDFLNDSYPEE